MCDMETPITDPPISMEAYEKVLGIVTGLVAAIMDHHGLITRDQFAKHLDGCAENSTVEGEAEILIGMANGIRDRPAPNLSVIEGGKTKPPS